MPHTVTRPPKLPVMIDLTTVSTPKQRAITVSPGKIDAALVEQAQEARVRSLPIVGDNSECLGAISVERLAELKASNTKLTADHATIPCNILPHLMPVSALLRRLRDEGVILHGADPDADDYQENWFGIVSTADLNRPIFRAHIYRMLVILETSLGQLIMDEFGDDWGAIRLLSDSTQKRIKEFYDEERAEGVDLSPVTNATLSDLFHIATESNNVWRLLEFDDPNQLRPIARGINDLRNTIMHPVRPLIVSWEELKDIVDAVNDVEILTDRMMKRIGIATG